MSRKGSAMVHKGSAMSHMGSAMSHKGWAMSHKGSAMRHKASAMSHIFFFFYLGAGCVVLDSIDYRCFAFVFHRLPFFVGLFLVWFVSWGGQIQSLTSLRSNSNNNRNNNINYP